MVNTVGMFGKFLRKEYGFWRISSETNTICYCKHNAKYGGIYAYIQPGTSGVRIVTQGISQYFTDFTKLGDFLGKLEDVAERNQNNLVRSLYLSVASRSLRSTFSL